MPKLFDHESVDTCAGRGLLNIQAYVRSDPVAVGYFVVRCEGGQIGNKEEVEEELDQACFMTDME